MSRARQVANFDPALLATDEVSLDKVNGGTLGTGTIGGSSVVNTTGAITTTGTATFSGDLVPSTPLSHRNMIINGGFDVWQRGTSFALTTAWQYTADRWFNYWASTSQQTVTKRTDATGVPFTTYIRSDNTTDSDTTWFQLIQRIEDYQHLISKTVTMSFYIRASEAVSDMRIYTNSGTTSSNFALTTSWVKQEITLTLGTGTVVSNGYLEITIDKSVAQVPANTSIDVAQVQLELGSSATPFEHRSYGDELARCQRYYQIAGTAVGSYIGVMNYPVNGFSSAYLTYQYETQMRSTPTPTNIDIQYYETGWKGTVVFGSTSDQRTILSFSGITAHYMVRGRFSLLAEL